MKFALRAPILKYTLFGMLFLNSPAQASEPRSERMEKTAAEVIAADSAAIPKGWDNDCRASYKAGYEAGYRAGYLHGRRTATQPHSSGRASATRYADGSIVPTRDTTASGRRFMHRIGAEFRPEYIFPTNPFVEGENRAGQPIDLSLSGHLRYSFQFRPGSIPDQIYGGAYQGIGAAYYDFGNPDELGNPIAVYLFQGARIARISPRLSFNYEWNFGLSFGWKPYDDAVNPLNKMMGSKMNAYLKEIADLARIEKHLTTHLARHTFASLSLSNHVPIESISKMLGHADIRTTQIYAKTQDKTIYEDMESMRHKFDCAMMN